MNKTLQLLLILMVMASKAMCHPIKMSTARLTYDKESKKITLVINFFVDDLATHIQKIYRQQVGGFDNPSFSVRELIDDYVNKKITIKINNVKHHFMLDGFSKPEGNVVQVKFSLLARGLHVHTIEVYNSLLFEAFKDQVNILHIDMEGKGENQIFRFSPGDSYSIMKTDFVCQ